MNIVDKRGNCQNKTTVANNKHLLLRTDSNFQRASLSCPETLNNWPRRPPLLPSPAQVET